MATIANLIVEISAKGTKLARGLKKSLKSVGAFAAKVGKTFAKLGGVMAAAFAGAGIAVVAIINSQAAAIDNLAKKSSALGITVEALQRMKFAAEQSGVEMASLTNAFRRLARGVGEAKMGMGPAKKALEAIGLSADKLSKMTLDEQFKTVAEALRQVKDRATQGALASQIFGRDWLPVLNLVNADIVKLGKEFDSFGIGITQSQAKAVESFNDSKNVLSTIFDGFLKQVTAFVAPAFDNIIKKVIATVKGMGGLKEVAKLAALGIVDLTIGTVDGMIAVGKGIDRAILGFKNLQLAAAKSIGFLSFLKDNFGRGFLGKEDFSGAQNVLKIEKEIFALKKKQQGGSSLSGVRGALQESRKQLTNPKIEISVRTEEGVIVDRVTKSDKFDLVVEQKLAESMKVAARQIAR